MTEEQGSTTVGVPRPIAIGIGIMGLLAIITGARNHEPPPGATPPAHFDTAFVRANGFMMDSLRLGRLRLGPIPSAVQAAAPVATTRPRPKARAAADSVSLKYSPRGCMPE